jgi:hypothetical protein
MREAQRRNLLFVSATANSRFLVASLLGMTKITLRVRFQTILAALVTDKAASEKRPSVARRTAGGGCPHN